MVLRSYDRTKVNFVLVDFAKPNEITATTIYEDYVLDFFKLHSAATIRVLSRTEIAL